MKNFLQFSKVLLIAFLTLFAVSCSQDNDIYINTGTTPQNPAQGLNFGKLTGTFTVENMQTKTAKSVNRASLNAWISGINVKATSLESSYIFSDLINIDETNTAGNNYQFDKIVVGNNLLEFVTTCNTVQKLNCSTFPTSTVPMDFLNSKIVLNPFAIYNSSFNFNVLPNVSNIIPTVNLSTQNGRIINTFTLLPELALGGYYAKLNISIAGTPQPEIKIDSINNAFIYWSDATATAGQTAVIKTTLYKSNGEIYSKMNDIINTVTASASIHTNYTILDNSVMNKQTTVLFNGQFWDNTKPNNIDSTVDNN